MKIFALLQLLISLVAVQTTVAGGKKGVSGKYFQSYWVGVDPNDGGDSRRTIIKKGKYYELVGRDTVLSLCGGGERGTLTGTGMMEGDKLVIKGPLTCLDGGSIDLIYTFTAKDDNLMVETLETDDGNFIYDAYFWRLVSSS
mmetsp:Transcript_2794/g.5652  ORF Transcript_2794/g.5652 Transcript_2794/m.5652 type:complete len:142 (-) Transcript_2794:133-558(-)|eukprot:CAMPEP_0172461228 /NCGR_PEP_ID=MMETSP1065-20121228/39713_1 /TAXON_ID=265537 /ORGANISM="Amphiprora paludosa, Strain CCMP125" /LENGTH=141 /DNA_ID=CAMNT_0013216479 /DNA_START=403 /DNA_END=828 /DNA_ORIENTATION=+